MNGLFDEISRKLEADAGQRGITAWDLAQLSPPLRKIVRVMLRELEMSYAELRRLATSPPAEEALTEGEFDEALERLLKQTWIVRLGQGERITYRVNLRRKRGSRLSDNLWEQLDRRITGHSPYRRPQDE